MCYKVALCSLPVNKVSVYVRCFSPRLITRLLEKHIKYICFLVRQVLPLPAYVYVKVCQLFYASVVSVLCARRKALKKKKKKKGKKPSCPARAPTRAFWSRAPQQLDESVNLHRLPITLTSFHPEKLLSHLCLTCNLASHSPAAVWLFLPLAQTLHPPALSSLPVMAVMSHAVYLNVKYWGGGREPFPCTLPVNGSDHNNLIKSGHILLGGY